MGGAGPFPPPLRGSFLFTELHRRRQRAPPAVGQGASRSFSAQGASRSFSAQGGLPSAYAGLRGQRSGPLPRPVSAPSQCPPLRRERFPDLLRCILRRVRTPLKYSGAPCGPRCRVSVACPGP